MIANYSEALDCLAEAVHDLERQATFSTTPRKLKRLDDFAKVSPEARVLLANMASRGARGIDDDGVRHKLSDDGLKLTAGMRASLREAATHIEHARPMFWSSDVLDLVLNVADQVDPAVVVEEGLAWSDQAWCYFERPFVHDAIGDSGKIVAISWTWGVQADAFDQHEAVGLSVVAWRKGWQGLRAIPLQQAVANAGAPLSTFDTGGLITESRPFGEFLIRFAIAAGAFLRSRLPAIERRPAERHARKRAAEKITRSDYAIDVITLRRRDPSASAEGAHSVEWAHRWIVRAHLRQHWFPSKAAHLPIVIAPYMKGPEDKPIKAPRARIFAAIR